MPAFNKNATKPARGNKGLKGFKKQKVEESEDDIIPKEDQSDSDLYSDGDSNDFEELEHEAKMLRDESDSEEEEDFSEQDSNEDLLRQAGEDGLDLPSEPESSGDSDEESDKEMDSYYADLGIDRPVTDEQWKKRAEKASKPVKVKEPSRKSKLITQMIQKARDDQNFNSISRVIKIVKSIFNTEKDQQEGEEAPKKSKDSLMQALNTSEYKMIFDFFVSEVAGLIIKSCGVDTEKYEGGGTLKEIYSHLTTKQTMLMKTFAANYNKLLKQSVDSQSTDPLIYSSFCQDGKSVVYCCLPFKIYSKKLATGLATILMRYSKADSTSQILVFDTLFHLIKYLGKPEFFDLTVKKMYVEFAKESKSGGGGHSI